jgi:hypothetical protein
MYVLSMQRFSGKTQQGASGERKVEGNVIAKRTNSVPAVEQEKVREEEEDMVSSCGCVNISSHILFFVATHAKVQGGQEDKKVHQFSKLNTQSKEKQTSE